MLVKESSDLNLQLSCVVQLAHRNGVFKKFTLNSRRQIVPLHDDCGAQTPQNMLLFLGGEVMSSRTFCGAPFAAPPSLSHLARALALFGRLRVRSGIVSLKFLLKLEI